MASCINKLTGSTALPIDSLMPSISFLLLLLPLSASRAAKATVYCSTTTPHVCHKYTNDKVL